MEFLGQPGILETSSYFSMLLGRMVETDNDFPVSGFIGENYICLV